MAPNGKKPAPAGSPLLENLMFAHFSLDKLLCGCYILFVFQAMWKRLRKEEVRKGKFSGFFGSSKETENW